MSETRGFEVTSDLPTCRCGHDREHHLVDPNRSFGFWSWILLFLGASGTPKQITFRCRQCGKVVEVNRDPEVLRKHRQ